MQRFVGSTRVNARYLAKAQASLVDTGIVDDKGQLRDLANWLQTEKPEELLELKTKLSERFFIYVRLIHVMPDANPYTLQLALVSEASSLVNAKLALNPVDADDREQVNIYRKRAVSDAIQAQETMERLAKSGAPEALPAKAWTLARTLKYPIREAETLENARTMAKEILHIDPRNRVGLGRSAQLEILEAFSIVSETPKEGREELIRAAIESLSKLESPSMFELSLLAEAQDAMAPQLAIEISAEAAQRYWSDAAIDKLAPETLASLFACLYRQGNRQESSDLVSNKVPNMAPVDQFVFRSLCADFCLRWIACHHWFPRPTPAASSIDALSVAVRMDPHSPGVLDCLEHMVTVDRPSELHMRLSTNWLRARMSVFIN